MIPAWLLYLAQAQLALLLLLAVYYGLLRRLTFHQLNRAYLLAALGLAAVYPLLDFGYLLPRRAVAGPLPDLLPTGPAAGPLAAVMPVAGPDYGAWLLGLYTAGAGLLLARLLVQVAALWRLHRSSCPAEADGVAFRAVAQDVSPFSFGACIYLNPAHHAPAELPVVLLHERVHVRQAHSLDVLLGQLHRALAWASPAAWLWLRAVQENHEFVADAAVLRHGRLPVRHYQYSLARLSALAAGPSLTTPFSFLLLKNRIAMMNARPSSSRQLLRYAAGLIALTGLAVSCATPKVAELPVPLSAQPNAKTYSIDKLTYFLNGLPSTKEEAFKAIDNGPATQNGETPQLYVFKGTKPGQSADMAALRRDFGSKVDDGIMLMITAGGEQQPAVQDFVRKYSVKLTLKESAQAQQTITRDYYRKLVDGRGLTDAEIGGRLVFINQQEATAEQLRALPAGKVSALAVADGPVAKYGERGKNGLINVLTKDRSE
ncbi:M56 family metallopeptidase [Hymenobacter actinosclerus]|uniref:Signal transducer regulating beta-lactamase production, contains metallopeptidase domain n=1 Tax=Hymenobacter actinosclerus TaxID=82805 RepID=A0A1I0HZP8_9BACT|nr:M56 family metallopeptidase [Hymenobacter actinosclerus]SET88825.1 Signal transducer regulating beta-lactamase production, contains metallopeptidase domain [Hymenobacter actinosclerus]